MKNFIHVVLIFCATLTFLGCCTKAIKIPPRVDGDSITLENARAGYYKLVVQLEVCELCDTDRDLADGVTENAEGIFELRSDELLTNAEYNAYIESIQARLMEVRRVCNTLAIDDKNATVPGNEDKYRLSEKAVDLTKSLNVALTHSAETLAEARNYVKNK
ncbi:MAG: hypothetical protein RIF32_06940 [Leptospirales bacterium]